MGWFKDAIEWITDKILRPVVNWIVKIIDDITRSLKKARIKFSYALADFLENDVNFFIASVLVIVGIFVLPHLIQYMAALIKKVLASAIMLAIKKGMIKLLDIKKIIDWKLLSDMMKVLFPEYKTAMNSLNMALSSFAKELGEGSAFIHAYIALGRGVTAGTTALLGLPPEATEFSWYEQASAWSGKLRSRIDRYVDHPEWIYMDIVDEVLLPLQEDYTAAQQAELDEIRSNIERVREIEGGVKLLESSVSDFVAAMPAEVEAVMLQKIGPGLEDIREAIDSLDVNLLDSVDAIYDALKEHENRIARMNQVVEEKRWEIRKQFAEYLLWPRQERWEFQMDVAELVLKGIVEPDIPVAIEQHEDYIDFATQLTEALASWKAPTSLSYEPSDYGAVASEPVGASKSWFVGEY